MIKKPKNNRNATGCRLVVLGLGNVSQKIAPAIDRLESEGLVEDILLLDLCYQRQPYYPTRYKFQEIASPDQLERILLNSRFFGENVRLIVACCSRLHVPYAQAAVGLVGAIAIEKPIALRLCDAERLRGQKNVFSIEHQLYKEDSIKFLQQLINWNNVESVSFDFLESNSVGSRACDPMIIDTGYHGLALLFAAMERHGFGAFELNITATVAAKYWKDSEGFVPENATAGRVEAIVALENNSFPVVMQVAKGIPKEAQRKILTVCLRDGGHVKVDLSEGGYMPHYRCLRDFVTRQNGHIGTELGIDIVGSVEKMHDMSTDVDGYRFGSIPSFIRIIAELEKLPL